MRDVLKEHTELPVLTSRPIDTVGQSGVRDDLGASENALALVAENLGAQI